MRGITFIVFFLLLAGAFQLRAQDNHVSTPDGSSLKIDSLSAPPKLIFIPSYPGFPGVTMPSLLSPDPLLFETKEQRAARLNALAYGNVMTSAGHYLTLDRPLILTKKSRIIYRSLRLFLSSPYKVPDGCVPLMNSSFPFIFAAVPGKKPSENTYSPDYFPQCIKTEYDFATGTYKQVPVRWSEYQKKLSTSAYLRGGQLADNK